MKKLILVNSLSHSGSTVLSMVLSGHSDLVSLGEIFQVLREDPNYWLNNKETICSCEKKVYDCPLWGNALRKIAENQNSNTTQNKLKKINESYQVLLEVFAEIYGDQKIALDTSKGFKHLKTVSTNIEIDTQVVYLMRDARAYATSQTRIARSQSRKGYRKVKQSTTYQLIKWYYANRQRQRYIRQKKLKSVPISYEELCFKSEECIKSICKTLEIEYQDHMIELTQANHHILYGNAIRLNEKKRSSLSYDSRWLANNDWALPYALFWNVRRYNKHTIYPNTL